MHDKNRTVCEIIHWSLLVLNPKSSGGYLNYLKTDFTLISNKIPMHAVSISKGGISKSKLEQECRACILTNTQV